MIVTVVNENNNKETQAFIRPENIHHALLYVLEGNEDNNYEPIPCTLLVFNTGAHLIAKISLEEVSDICSKSVTL